LSSRENLEAIESRVSGIKNILTVMAVQILGVRASFSIIIAYEDLL
jgi:hypothetical protein